MIQTMSTALAASFSNQLHVPAVLIGSMLCRCCHATAG